MLILWIPYTIRLIRRNCIIRKSFIILIFSTIFGIILSELYTICFSSINLQSLPHLKTTTTDDNQLIDFDNNNYYNYSNDKLAYKLYKEVKILCWVMTNPQNHHIKINYILNTWGTRCNKLLVMSSKEDKELGIIGLPVNEGKQNLWHKTKEALKYIYKNHFNEYDWFFKADDDTYAIIENLRFLLYEYDTRKPIYFGYKFSPIKEHVFMSGAAGYVMSKEALKRFIQISLPNPKKCYQGYSGAADLENSRCLENVGVIAGDSRDIDKRGRFFVFPPQTHLLTEIFNMRSWYWKYMYYKTFEGLNCCSDYTISFHDIFGKETDVIDYFIYKLKPYGVKMLPRLLPIKNKF